jgi:D-alanyl-D-alanine carboxypeptidase/D-alanyl-D-alanine-endopeptidase (penicillin-binding protein 4)
MSGAAKKTSAVFVVAALCLGGLQPALAATPTPTPVPAPTSTATPTPTATSKPIPTTTLTPKPTPTPTPNKPKTCSIRAAATSRDLAHFYGFVMNAKTGEVYANIRGDEQTPSASVMKVFTAAAALETMSTQYTATTRVFAIPSQPGVIVLRGGGDHTLTRLNSPRYTTYKKPARLSTLAAQALASLAPEQIITKIILDDTYFDKPFWNKAWKDSDRTNGYISHITSLQVDSDRANPDLTSTAYSGTRSKDPVLAAGNFFKKALGSRAATATLETGVTPDDAILAASVQSQPMSVWLDHALKYSDNTETEMIARHALRINAMPTTFENIQPLMARVLKTLGVDSKKLVMTDGSGLAQSNRVTARMVATLMAKATDPASVLNPMISYLPVSGISGTLATRFTGSNKSARGYVHAKSGFIPGLYSLAGVVYAKDGTAISFAGFARSAEKKTVGYGARNALDTLADRLYECGSGSYF